MNREVFEREMLKRGFECVKDESTKKGSLVLWKQGTLEVEIQMYSRGDSPTYDRMLADLDRHLED